jgi:hypothetical protein
VIVWDRLPFENPVAVDTEFNFGGHKSMEEASRSGERPRPVCMAAKNLRTGRTWQIWRGELGSRLPFPIDVLISFYSSAELGYFLAEGFPFPTYVLDLFTEFRALTNGRNTLNGASLLGALTYFGLEGIGVNEKQVLRTLILSGDPWTAEQCEAIQRYCLQSDVEEGLERLLPAMLPHIDLPRALLRGRFMKAAARIEWNGVPIDTTTLALLRQYWTDIQDDLIAAVDRDYGVFDGRSFRLERWERWLATHGVPWPRLESGRLDLSDDTFRQMSRSHPSVSPMRELRSALSEMRLSDLSTRTVQAVRLGCGLRDGSGRAGGPHRSAGDRWPRPAAGAPRNLSPVLEVVGRRGRSRRPYRLNLDHVRLAAARGPNFNPRSLRNFPCQANGAEMLRLAACFATEQSIEVCALVHDAVLICAPLDRLDADIERMRACMAKASRIVLDGFELRTDVHPVRYPDRYRDPRGTVMWERVMRLIAAREGAKQRGVA